MKKYTVTELVKEYFLKKEVLEDLTLHDFLLSKIDEEKKAIKEEIKLESQDLDGSVYDNYPEYFIEENNG